MYVKEAILTCSNLDSFWQQVFYLESVSNWDKDDWVACYLQSQEARITNSQAVPSTHSERHFITLVTHCNCVGHRRRWRSWHMTEPPSKRHSSQSSMQLRDTREPVTPISHLPLPPQLTGKSGILSETELTLYTLVVAMNRGSHFGEQFGSFSKG